VEEGTATSLKGLLGKESEIAVKTGTAQDSKSLLLAGYEPNGVTVVVWVGNDDGSAVKGFLNKKTGQPGKAPTGGQVAAPIWGETMKAATEGHKPAKFSPPTSVIEVEGKYYLEGTQLQQPVAPELPTIESSTPSAAPAQPSPTPVSPATQEETEGESNRTE
jgi:penicillin-binding protein 1A